MARSSRQLYYRKSGTVYSNYLYDSLSDMTGYNYIIVEYAGTPLYARLVSTSDSMASSIRVRKNGIVYAVAKERYNPGSQDFTATSTFTVPDGVYSISALVVGGGGGSGGNNSSGDQWQAGAGGSGGHQTVSFNVVPGDTLSINVGAGGRRGFWVFNGGWSVPNDANSSGSTTGETGGTTYVLKNGVQMCYATGGGGGVYQGHGGAGGWPNGVAGGNGGRMNDYPQAIGGNNGTGYGKGGNSQQSGSGGYYPWIQSESGQSGFVRLSW